jgi:23S rRNA pseudouridine1911/1915/1917 synthase
MAVRETSGRHAITDYWLEQRFGPPLKPLASLVGARLGTGRTHQVRVHLSHIGCPVIGDPVYGRRRNSAGPPSLKSFGRQALHAAVLEFRHPGTGKIMKFASELPQDMARLLAELNNVK